MIRTTVAAFFCCVLIPSLTAQVKAGQYANGSFDNKGFDTINLGSLNVMAAIPIVNKPGRGGTNFTYTLAYNGAVWYPAYVNGVKTFVNTQNWGWQAQTEVVTGYISYASLSTICNTGSGKFPDIETMSVVYHDSFGGSHPFLGSIDNSNGLCPNDHDTLSGHFSMDGQYQYGGPANTWGLKDRSGHIINAPAFTSTPGGYVSASYIDTNGNKISVDGSGNFTDTMGLNVLAVSGTAPSPVTMSFTDAGGTLRTATISYETHTVRTNAVCSGIVDANISNVPLVSNITMADGSAYEFTYEDTPGISGAVTGRLASITLPTGGTISYAYYNGNNGSGMVCADGSTSAITRTATTDIGSSVWKYVRTASTNSTLVTDGLGNQTQMYFVLATSGDPAEYYETSRSVYQGTGGTALVARLTCYNQAAESACKTTPLTLPISQIDTYATVDGVEQDGAAVKFNAYGLATERDTYDFGSATARGSSPIQTELWNYPTGGIVNLLSSYQIKDASGNLEGQTGYTYDTGSLTTTSGLPQHVAASEPRGNMTAVDQYAGASNFTINEPVYDDAGTVRETMGSFGQTNFTSFDATDTFTTAATLPAAGNGITLTQAAAYDSNTGVTTSTTDPNGYQTIYSEFDALNRPQLISYADGGHAHLSYSPTEVIQSLDTNSSGSTQVSTYTEYDGYGRTSRIANANGQASNPYYQVDYCYDANGNVAFQPVKYQSAGFSAAKRCSGAGDTTTYDALGRVTKVTHADTSYAQYSYHGRATQFTDENGVSRILQVDGLGRLTAVCEISGTMGSDTAAACGQDIAGTGFLTKYAYSTGNTTTIYQGAQTRIIKTDWLGRLTSLQQPEAGGPTTYSYSYNANGLQVIRKRPKANQSSPSTLTTTTMQYDLLGRILNVSYDDGTATKTFTYDDHTTLNPSQVQRTNVKGRLSTAMTYVPNTQGMLTGNLYSYDPVGRVTDMWECGAAATCGNGSLARGFAFSFDDAGRQTGVSDAIAGNIVYGVSLAGEVTSITNTTYNNSINPPHLLSSVQYGPYGPTSYQFGNGLTGVQTYDSSGRRGYTWLCAGGVKTANCSGGTQIYGLLTAWKGPYLANSIDTTENTGGYYTYDSLGRVTTYTGNAGVLVSYSWAYDRYGNRYGATPGANISISEATNHIQTSGFVYDAAGNVTGDGVHTYTYDAEYNLVSVDGGSTAAYTYNALNQRVGVSNAQGSNEYTYDFAGRRMGTWKPGTNTGTQGQIWWGSTPVAYRDNDGSTYFEQADWVGTQRILSNYAGVVSSSYTSRPWGDAYATSGKDDNLFHYAGLEQSENTGIVHAQYRDYDSSLGRWMSPDSYTGSYDWTNPQSFNRFTYAGNRPHSAVDPSGQVQNEDPCDEYTCFDGGGGGGYDPCAGADACVTAPPPPSPPITNPTPSGPTPPQVPGPISNGGGAPNNWDPNKSHTPREIDAHIAQCRAEANAAQASQPSPVPNANQLLTGVFTAGINLLRTSSPQGAATGFAIGILVRSVFNELVGLASYDGTLAACLNGSSTGGLTTAYPVP